ncbi:MAG: GFA family protein [Aestuariivirga sp.]|uniref:GFA family protein n=1 Tax=Aestuariivirga sp. TaxID=2650926 RepID=UPI0038D05E96
MKTGSCLCGAVAFEIHGPLRPVIACHCVQCRKQTGTYMSATACADADLAFTHTDGLAWYRSSPEAQRGFCRLCGSALFWKADGSGTTSISAGAIDGPSGAPLDGHIFCDSAGDYYEISGGSYRKDRW